MKTIEVLSLNDPWDILGREVPEHGVEDSFTDFENEMNDFYSRPSAPLKNIITKGQICVGKSPKNDKWYRLMIEEVFRAPGGNKAKCFLLDYGQTANYVETSLCEINDRFSRLPYRAKRFCIADIQPLTLVTSHEDLTTWPMPVFKWDDVGKKTLKRIFQGVEKTEVELRAVHGDVNYIDLYVVKKDGLRFSVKDELIKLCRARHNPNIIVEKGSQGIVTAKQRLEEESFLQRNFADSSATETSDSEHNAQSNRISEQSAFCESPPNVNNDDCTIAQESGNGEKDEMSVQNKPRVIGRGRPGCQLLCGSKPPELRTGYLQNRGNQEPVESNTHHKHENAHSSTSPNRPLTSDIVPGQMLGRGKGRGFLSSLMQSEPVPGIKGVREHAGNSGPKITANTQEPKVRGISRGLFASKNSSVNSDPSKVPGPFKQAMNRLGAQPPSTFGYKRTVQSSMCTSDQDDSNTPSNMPSIFHSPPRKVTQKTAVKRHHEASPQSSFTSPESNKTTFQGLLGRGMSPKTRLEKSPTSKVGMMSQAQCQKNTGNAPIVPMPDIIPDNHPKICEDSADEAVFDKSPRRCSLSLQVNFSDQEQVRHFSSSNDILGTGSPEHASNIMPRPILKKDKNPLLMLQPCQESDSDSSRDHQWSLKVRLVCEICKGNHETNNENCPGYDMNQRAICFKGHLCVMSNMYPCTVHYKDRDFSSSEHAYQWAKAMTVGEHDVAEEIFESNDGYAAKRLAGKIENQELLSNWRKNHAIPIMKQIAQSKFDCVEEFRKEMIDSRGMYLIESTVDTFWGVGFLRDVAACCRPQYWPGENVMGRILMDVRDKYLGVPEELLPYKEVGRMIREVMSSPRDDPLDVEHTDIDEESYADDKRFDAEDRVQLQASVPCPELMRQFTSDQPTELVSIHGDTDVLPKKALNCFDLGLLVDAEEMPICRTRLSDINLHQFIKNKFSDEAITASQIIPLWMYSWPSLIRGRNFVGIAQQENVKKSYLPALMSIMMQGRSSALPEGTSPRVIILVPSWKVAKEVHYECQQLVGNSVRREQSVLAIYGGGYEETQEIPLLKGCSVLVATPHCLLRMLDRKILELKRLCHLALHDAEKLLDDFSEQMCDLIERWNECRKLQVKFHLDKQIILIASIWTTAIDTFVKKHAPGSIICIGSKSEAAIYGGLKILPETCKSSNRLDRLKDIMATPIDRTVVFTNSRESALTAYNLLCASSVYAILADDGVQQMELDDISQKWNRTYSRGSHPVFVATDSILTKVKIDNAQRVIHFDLPKEKGTFNERLWCMRANFKLPLLKKNVDNSSCCVSNILVTERATDRQVSTLLRIIKHMDIDIPRSLVEFSEITIKGREHDKHNKLCPKLKAFGKCMNESKCLRRHVINKLRETPNANQKFVKIPTCGRVKVKVTWVKHASEYWVRLLEHEDRGKKTTLGKDYAALCLKLNMYYSKMSNRKRCDCVVLNDYCALEDMQHCFNRVQIEETGPLNKYGDYTEVLVRLVDTGEARWVSVNDLYQLASEFIDIPFQAVEVFACKVKPFDRDSHFTEKATRYVSERILQKELEGKIVLSLGHTMWLDPLVNRQYLRESGVVVDNFAVHEELIDMKLAMRNRGHLNVLYAACEAAGIELPELLQPATQPCFGFNMYGLPVSFRTVEFPKETGFHPVQVQAVEHPGLFFVQLYGHKSLQSDLEVTLQDHVKLMDLDNNFLQNVKVGSLVLAQLPIEEDEVWYRCKVVGVNKDLMTYDVLFLDHGDTDTVPMNSIKPFPSQFINRPTLAIECSLAFLSPIDQTWSDQSSDFLWEVTGPGRTCMAKVMQTCEGKKLGYTHYKIELIDTNSETDTNIAQELVAGGFARPTKELAEVHISPKPGSGDGRNVQLTQISSLSKAILAVRDSNEQIRFAEQIFHIVKENPTEFRGIRECGGLKSLCQLIGYIKDPRVLRVLLDCITDLAGADSENCLEVCKSKGILNVINIFARTEDSTKMHALEALQKLAESYICGEYMVKNGMLSILNRFIKSQENEDHLFMAVDLLSSLVQHIDDDGTLLLNTGCVDSLLLLVLRVADDRLHLYCVRCLTDMTINNSGVIEYLRREGHLGTKICQKFNSLTDVKVQEAYLFLLHSLAASNRDVREILKDSLNEMQIRKIKRNSSEKVRETCSMLLRMMRYAVTSDESSGESKIASSCTEPLELRAGHNKKMLNIGETPRICRPDVLWTQNRHSIALTVKLESTTGVCENCVAATETSISFSALVDDTKYSFDFHLYELIHPGSRQLNITPKLVEIGFHKKDRGRWPRLMRDKGKVYRQLRPDLEHYIDSESESDSESERVPELISEKESPTRPLEILRKKKPRSREMTFPTDFGPAIDYNAAPEPLPYEESDDPAGGNKMKDALDSDEASDAEIQHESHGMDLPDEFNPFGAS